MRKSIKAVEEPRADWCRKINIVYMECLGNACKSFSIEMCMTFGELTEFVTKIMNNPNYRKEKGNDGE